MTHFNGPNMSRFLWKRIMNNRVIILHSLKTTLEYYKGFETDGWQRWPLNVQARATARKVARLNALVPN